MPSSASGSSSWGRENCRLAVAAPTGGSPEKWDPRASEVPIRLLLISDLLLERAGLRHVLDTSGIICVGEVDTCAEAVGAAARERPDVILLDLDLRADAFQCVGEIVAAAPGSRIIALSDRTRAADHQVLIELGATGLVLKNERPEILIKAIRKVHGGEVWLDRTITAQVLARIARRRHGEDVEAAKIATLTRREREIVTLVGEGLKNAMVAQRLFISEATARNHLTSILDKLGLSDRFELAVYAFRQGLVRYHELHDPPCSSSSAPSQSVDIVDHAHDIGRRPTTR
jgi:two-component system, NarL family, nitrate/nitrite response regulator NarL